MGRSIAFLIAGCISGVLVAVLFFANRVDDHGPTAEAPYGGASERASSAPSRPETTQGPPGQAADPAGDDPSRELAAALQSTDPLARYREIKRIGAAWARNAPVAALAYADALPPELRDVYRASITREWANLDPAGFLAYAESAGLLDELKAGLELLAAVEPQRVFDLAARLPPDSNQRINSIQAAALKALLEIDAAGTLTDLAAMSPGRTRDDFLDAAALHYARLDPAAAIAWMSTLASPAPSIRENLLRGAVATDFELAYGLTEGANPMSMIPVALVRGTLDVPAQVGDVASELARQDGALAAGVLANVVTLWVSENPEAVADWLLANESNVSAVFAGNAAGQVAQMNLERALSDLERVPPEWRNQWIPELAGAYAAQDARGAIDWIAQFQGEASYEAALNQVAMRATESDPRAAAQFVQNVNPSLQIASVNYIGTTYAQVDPLAATQWALGLDTPAAILEAAAGVVYGWAYDDVDAAERWARSLPRGGTRDAVITQLMRRSDDFELDPAAFLDAFSSPEARLEGIQSAMSMLSARDLVRARQLLEAAADDPDLGAWATERLQAISR